MGAGIGIGSAYTDCSRAFDAPSSSSANLAAPKDTTETSPVSQVSWNLFWQMHLFGGFNTFVWYKIDTEVKLLERLSESLESSSLADGYKNQHLCIWLKVN